MSYTINKTNGSVLATVNDGTINTTASSLTLIGKNYAGYGEFQNENFVKLLENSANATAPSTPLTGQLWYDSISNILKVYNGDVFKVISGSTAAESAPIGQVIGDLWYDTVSAQLKVFDGTNNILVGPGFSASTGTTGPIVDTIIDVSGVEHVVVRLYVEDAIVAIYSKDAKFTPAETITGFETVGPGLNLSTTIANAIFNGTAKNADMLDNLNSTSFMRTDVNTSTTGTLTVDTDEGFYIGADDDIRMYVSGNTTYLKNQTNNGNLLIQVNSGGVNTTCITFEGSTGDVIVNTKLVVNGNIDVGNITATGTVTGGNLVTKGIADIATLKVTGNATIAGNLSVSKNIIGGNIITSGTLDATDTITGGNLVTDGTAKINTLKVTGDATVDKTLSVTGNITGGNVSTGGNIDATGNITGGNLTISDTTKTGTLDVTGNATVSKDLTVLGNLSANITSGSISMSKLTNATSLTIYNSSGTALKTIYGTSS